METQLLRDEDPGGFEFARRRSRSPSRQRSRSPRWQRSRSPRRQRSQSPTRERRPREEVQPLTSLADVFALLCPVGKNRCPFNNYGLEEIKKNSPVMVEILEREIGGRVPRRPTCKPLKDHHMGALLDHCKSRCVATRATWGGDSDEEGDDDDDDEPTRLLHTHLAQFLEARTRDHERIQKLQRNFQGMAKQNREKAAAKEKEVRRRENEAQAEAQRTKAALMATATEAQEEARHARAALETERTMRDGLWT